MLLQVVINGLLLGSVYALAATGFSMVWGVMGVINLAHGSFVMVGAYITYAVYTHLGLDPFFTIPLSAIALFVLGYAMQRVFLNRLMKTSLLLSLVLTFGVDLILVDGARLIFTADFRGVNTAYSSTSLDLGGYMIPYVRLVTFVLAIALAVVFFAFLNLTKRGQSILATALDRETSRLMGIDPLKTYALTAGIAAALAGATGSLASMLFPVSPGLGLTFTGAVFVVTVLGGIGSIEGAVLAGLIYGLIQSLAAAYIGINYQQIIAFAMFLVVVLVRPRGLLGKQFFGVNS